MEKKNIIHLTTNFIKSSACWENEFTIKKMRSDVQGVNNLGKHENASWEKYHYLIRWTKNV